MRLAKGQVALVTGAANGIGRALARTLAARGLRLALVDRDAAALGVVCAELGAQPFVLDVRDRAALTALPGEVERALGPVDLLVCAAGVSVGGRLEQVRAEDLDWILDINLLAVVQLVRAALPGLLTRPQAHIVTFGSTFSLLPGPAKTAYCASKAGVLGFSEALRAELYGGPVGVSCVLPGAVRTDIVRRSRVPSEQVREREHQLLQERGLDPAQVAERVLRAVERGEGRVLVGPDALVVGAVARLLGGGLAAWVGRARGRLPWWVEGG